MNNAEQARRLREAAQLLTGAASALSHGRPATAEQKVADTHDILRALNSDRCDACGVADAGPDALNYPSGLHLCPDCADAT